ncbi:outer membrane protein [Phaeobacter gallaeciensis]|uniref:outer membrane protein n=1 Tax=Phaeobacter gallaeciensis TaxID=60890 RepID=UPI000BBB7652|nr:porin [Phaeobacter gallaeciensis]ATF18307.1 Outer membrane protein (porin) [Phaeobacter gallaeciensis]ATF22416.1 Outer membrane protein (porin) [Phaeobacter gallaeciensis]
MIPAFIRSTDRNLLVHRKQRRRGIWANGFGSVRRAAIAGLAVGGLAAAPGFAGDWSGFFLGASMARVQAAPSERGSVSASGLHLGYDHDFGRVVLGGEVEVDRSGRVRSDLTEEQTRRIKLRAGYDMGETLGYLTIGSARNETATDSDNGAVYGLGLSYSLNRALRVSGEYLHQDASDGAAVQAPSRDILSIRASFQF